MGRTFGLFCLFSFISNNLQTKNWTPIVRVEGMHADRLNTPPQKKKI